MANTLPLFAFADISGLRHVVDADDINVTGTWSGTGTYFSSTLDVVDYSNGNYICIVDNIGYNPQLTPAKWSPLVIIVPGTVSATALVTVTADGAGIPI
jgi:hypothetical protein